MISGLIPNIHKEGYLFIAIFFVISCLAFAASWGLGIICMGLTFFCVGFFRDPVRVVPKDENLVISPADGIISKIEAVKRPVREELDSSAQEELEEVFCISIFLSVFNVHVNRIPISGQVKHKKYRPGKFISATLDKSSEENEKQIIVIENKLGKRVIVEQIAGLIARRIVCNLENGQEVKKGDRFGIIRFGSRVNIFLPRGVKPSVMVGQTAVGGETVLALLEGGHSELESEAI